MTTIPGHLTLLEKIQYRVTLWNPKWLFRLHRRVYQLTGGRLATKMRGIPVLLLTTTGRQSGKQRTVALMYFQDGDDCVIMASNSGEDKPPAWWLNIKAKSEVQVQVGTRRFTADAIVASPEEHQRLWPQVVAMNPFYAHYQERTNRQIGLVILKSR